MMKLCHHRDSYLEPSTQEDTITNMMNGGTINKRSLWYKLRSKLFTSRKGKSMKDGEEKGNLSRKLNVNEEYKEVFRTQSYGEIWNKVQINLKMSTLDQKFDPSSSSPSSSSSPRASFYVQLSDSVLEPGQEAVNDMVESSDLKVLLLDYFKGSLEACNVCELLLRGIHKTRSNHRLLQRVIRLSNDGGEKVVQHLARFRTQRNPLSIILNGKVDFDMIHGEYATLLKNMTSRRRKLKRREKLTRFFKKTIGYGFVITYVVLTIGVLVLAMHSVVGLLGAPGILIASSSRLFKKTKKGKGCSKLSKLEKLASQLDVAARGVYILINDFDTVGRLVTRVHDEIEHMKALADMCVRNSESHELVKETIREIHVHEVGFLEQLEELEDHIYLCFLTINRTRRLVIQEILSPSLDS